MLDTEDCSGKRSGLSLCEIGVGEEKKMGMECWTSKVNPSFSAIVSQ